ncbi:MAG: accessory factor UbiK family protein [Alphaproteobacteria bacterium]|nr:accessory factor UbiK family protein [Alphaproteobacteria bacterium]
MQKNHKFFEDLSRMASSAGGTFLEMKRELENTVAAQIDKVLHRMDLVTREDFNMVREMAVKARSEQEKLAARVDALEKQLAAKTKKPSEPAKAGTKAATGPKTSSAKKPATKKPAAKKVDKNP